MGLSERARAELNSRLYADSYDGSTAWRAQIVLWRDEGYSAAQVAKMAGTSRPTVYKWVDRYAAEGIDGLESRTSSGRPPEISPRVRARILALSRMSPPADTGLTHWSSRELAGWLRTREGVCVSHSFVADLWRAHDLQPHRVGTFKLSTDPAFAEKMAEVVGLYLDPPVGAVVLSLDEKTQVQALDRTQPVLPMDFGRTAKQTHDYIRHGTTNLFAALNTGTGQVAGACFDRRRTTEFITFLDQAVAPYADQPVHVICDNLSTHRGEPIDTWQQHHPNVTFHYTPTGSSWLNQVETWFGIITKQSIRRGTFRSVKDLIGHINAYITNWNQDAKPFRWTATPEQILAKVRILERDFHALLDNNRNHK